MSPWDLLGFTGVALYLIGGWLAIVVLALLFMRGGTRKRTPAPPAGPRTRLVQSRDRVGEVRILPGTGDAENAWTRSVGRG